MLDILAIGAHPDDIEIFMGGAVAAFKAQGLRVGVCDMTRGENGTYGDMETRRAELTAAAEVLSLDARFTLDLPDGNVRNTQDAQLKIIDVIRKTRPELVFSFADFPMRHPDHYAAGQIVRECIFLAGLEKIETEEKPFRPSSCVMFPELIVDRKPDFVVDITEFWDTKIASIRAYGSQVTAEKENDRNTKTFIRSNRFWEVLEARATLAGSMVGVTYGEPFFTNQPVRLNNVMPAFVRQQIK